MTKGLETGNDNEGQNGGLDRIIKSNLHLAELKPDHTALAGLDRFDTLIPCSNWQHVSDANTPIPADPGHHVTWGVSRLIYLRSLLSQGVTSQFSRDYLSS
ncbi:hypothetical protein J6590_010777 [Homalodisca vitripennis]|nr:hypothetical protein J6590_010777 [Homalodisca vitripennis]